MGAQRVLTLCVNIVSIVKTNSRTETMEFIPYLSVKRGPLWTTSLFFLNDALSFPCWINNSEEILTFIVNIKI